MADGVRPFSQLAQGRGLCQNRRNITSEARQPGIHRLAVVVRRRLQCPRRSSSGRGWEKSLQRHPDEPADHALGRSKGGFGTKFHVVVDGAGIPLAIDISAGEVHESTRAESVISQAIATLIGRRRQKRKRRYKPRQLAGDKAYSTRRLRDWLDNQNIEPIIPHKENEKARHDPAVWFNRFAYRGRAVVEQCVGWLKEFRRIATRFEKLAVHFHGMLQLAMIRRYLRLLFSDSA